MSSQWIFDLQRLVEERPCLIIRFSADEWELLLETRNAASEFTVARAHQMFDNVKVPTLAIVLGAGTAYLGIASHSAAVTTLETSVKIRRAFEMRPSTQTKLLALVTDQQLNTILEGQLASANPIVRLSPKVSSAVVSALAKIDQNAAQMKRLADFMARPKRYTGTAAMEEDAVQTALKAFGIAPNSVPDEVQVAPDYDGALRRISALEDAAIEHDARTLPGLKLVQSEITGRAVFRKRDEEMEIFTANKRPLEKVMGVDLVYLNLTRSNIAMLQYKMLTSQGIGEEKDWIYRPDKQLAEEIQRMETFAKKYQPGELEYRLNPGAFYLKFVRRDGLIKNNGIILPLDHYKLTLRDPSSSLGVRGGVRISYKSLGGRYIPEEAFLALLRAGYIGPDAKTTDHFATLVRRLIDNDHAVVGAIVTHQDAAKSRMKLP